MPVRSSTSTVLVWPDRATVIDALTAWAVREVPRHPELIRIGYFGSYARGDWGVGSDLDLVAVVSSSNERFERRAVVWATEELPVPTELLVYTADEWSGLVGEGTRFGRMLGTEVVWLDALGPRPAG